MDDKSKRLARYIGAALTAARWILMIMLAIMVPAMILGFLMPDGLSISGVLTRASTASDTHGLRSIGPILAYASSNLALTLLIVTKLRRLMRTATTGQPFDPANTVRLHWIAAAMAGMAMLATLVRPMIPGLGRSLINMASPDLNLGLWLAALVVLVLAEVFREGTRLREDVDMTV